ncbi:MAG: 6-bladed beta-propeller [Balneolaceae bacterium]|nr:6-bladed beta-propeller [Balneolaceae bacterium]
MGSRGRGPGEFLSFKEVHITADDKLLIADRILLRITKFDINGNVIDTFTLPHGTQEVAYFSQILQLSNKKNLILYKDGSPKSTNDFLFHVWDTEFNEILQEFGSFKELKYKNDFAKAVGSLG